MTDCDFSCDICKAMTFKGEESYKIDTGERMGVIKVCAMCGVGAEALGWRLY